MVDLLTSKRRLAANNFFLGLFRGIGFFLGVTIVGSLVLGVGVAVAGTAFGKLESLLGMERGTVGNFFRGMAERGENLADDDEGGFWTDSDSETARIVREVLREENLIPPEALPEDEESSQVEESEPPEDK
jgi:hypothetical protein